jgi:nitrous oxide reductase accessory protein NosL
MNRRTFTKWLISFVLLLWIPALQAESLDLPKPAPTDTCPVCGMFVAKYPEWVGTVLYKDGHAHHFDGAKDLFKYLLNMPKWAPGHREEDIQSIGVTEYYSVSLINARKAWYVIGSDVLGPMGHELIPLETEEDAKEFSSDHGGKRILRFEDVTYELLLKLDEGLFE